MAPGLRCDSTCEFVYEEYIYFLGLLQRIRPRTPVPTNRTTPMTPSQSSPWKVNPTTERITHATSRMMINVHMF